MLRLERYGPQDQEVKNPQRKVDASHQLPFRSYKSILIGFPVEVQGVVRRAVRLPNKWLRRFVGSESVGQTWFASIEGLVKTVRSDRLAASVGRVSPSLTRNWTADVRRRIRLLCSRNCTGTLAVPAAHCMITETIPEIDTENAIKPVLRHIWDAGSGLAAWHLGT